MFPLTVALERAARSFPLETAMVEEDGRAENWSDHVDEVSRLAGALSGIGLAQGARFAILAPNSADQAKLIHAGYWSGRVPVPLNYRLALPELAAILRKSGAQLLFVAPAFFDVARTLQADGWDGRLFLLGPGRNGITGTEDLIARHSRYDPVRAATGDEAILLFTGGTTGEGKGVPLTHGNVVSNAFQVIAALGSGPGDRYLHVAPMFHSADLLGTAVTLAGGSHSYLAQPSPVAIVDALESRNVTMTMAPPVLLDGIVRQGLAEGRALERLRIFICGGSPVPFDLLDAASAHFPSAALVQGYGLTETAPILSFLHLPQVRAVGEAEALLSAGRPLAGVEMRLLDTDQHGAGELAVRGPNVFSGYLDRAADTEAAFDDGWFRTGDAARFDAHGFLHILDRRKDVIITGGENVYSTEVESVLLDHPAIVEAAVIGVPDPKWGERVAAVVVAAPDAAIEPEALSDHCRGRLGGFKLPREFRQVDALPKSALGKTLKTELRKLFGDPLEV
ncbi:MAG: AMP-binding protein [Pseudomonadota bacterium]